MFVERGGAVLGGYWRQVLDWGAGDSERVRFINWHDADPYVQVDGQGDDTLVSLYHDTERKRVLLLVSNLAEEPELRALQIRVDTAALGLPGKPKLRELPVAPERPEGRDPFEDGQERKKVEDVDSALKPGFDELEELGGMDLTLESEEQAEAKQEQSYRVEQPASGQLTIPVRDRDFRVIALE